MRPPRKHDNELILGLVSVLEEDDGMTYDDKTVSSLEKWFRETLTTPVTVHKRVVANARFTIEKALRELVDIIGCDLVITTGAVGPTRRDAVPESTVAIASRLLPGLAERLRQQSADPLLSRHEAALRDTPEQTALIVNLDNDPRVLDALAGSRNEEGNLLVEGLFEAFRRCLHLVDGPQIETHESAPKETIDVASAPVDEIPSQSDEDETDTEEKEEEKPRETDVPTFTPVPAFQAEDILTVTPSRTRVPPEATVIWLHGMGVDNTDFADFPDQILQLGGPICRFILPNAPVREISAHPGYPLRAWYDVLTDRFDDIEDKEGIEETSLKVSRLITDLVKLGVPRNRIFLGGFSQGAATALYTGLRQSEGIGGIIALSGYLPLAAELFNDITVAGRETPVFMAHGNYDSVISPYIAQRGARVIGELTPKLLWRTYEMDHEVRQEELADMIRFMNALV